MHSSALSSVAELQPWPVLGKRRSRIFRPDTFLLPWAEVISQVSMESGTGREQAYIMPQGGSAIPTSVLTEAFLAFPRLIFSFPIPSAVNFLIHNLSLPCGSLSSLTCVDNDCFLFLSSVQISFIYLKTVYPVFPLVRFCHLG